MTKGQPPSMVKPAYAQTQLERVQVFARRLDAIEATPILVVLVKAADDQFHRIVDQRMEPGEIWSKNCKHL